MRIYDRIRRKLMRILARERKVSYGDQFPGKCIFVLRRFTLCTGMASNIIAFLGLLKYMEEKYPQAIPVIDMKNTRNSITEDKSVDGWSLFFEQPNSIDVEVDNVKHCKNVILCNGFFEEKVDLPQIASYNKLALQGWSRLFDTYIRLKPNLQLEFEKEWKILFPEKKKILGVKYRGTDYTLTKPAGHFVQPTLQQMKPVIDKYLKTNYDCIFLATEEKSALHTLREWFGDRVLSIEKDFIEYENGAIMDFLGQKTLTRMQATYDYLKELYFLSKCDGFVSGKSSGVIPTILWNHGNFNDVNLFDLGRY